MQRLPSRPARPVPPAALPPCLLDALGSAGGRTDSDKRRLPLRELSRLSPPPLANQPPPLLRPDLPLAPALRCARSDRPATAEQRVDGHRGSLVISRVHFCLAKHHALLEFSGVFAPCFEQVSAFRLYAASAASSRRAAAAWLTAPLPPTTGSGSGRPSCSGGRFAAQPDPRGGGLARCRGFVPFLRSRLC